MHQILIVVSATLASAAPSEETVSIRFWHFYGTDTWPVMERLVEKFEAAHPAIDIVPEYQGNHDLLTRKLLASVVAQDPPAVATLGCGEVARFAATGWLRPIALDAADREDFFPAVLAAYTLEDRLWALPVEGAAYVLYWNRRLFAEAGLPQIPPRTWEELIAAGKALTRDLDGDGAVDQWGFARHDREYVGASTIFNLYFGQGAEFFRDARPTLDTPELRAALELWDDLHRVHGIAPVSLPPMAIPGGRVGMWIGGTWSYPALREQLDLGLAPLPVLAHRASLAGPDAIVVTRTDPQREDAAQQFVRWLTATEQYVELCTALVYLPVRASVLTHPRYRAFLQTEPELAAIAGSMREVRTKPVDARWPVMQDALNAAREAVELGAATPAEALATAQARVEAALAREAQRGGANVAVFSGGAALALCALLLVAWRARRPGTALGAHPYPRGAHRLLVLPQVLFFGCFTAAPLLGAVGMSFVRWDLLSPPKFAGWGNYAGLLTSQEFHAALRRTLWWVLLVTPLGTCIALGVALLLHGAGRARRWFAPLYFLPSVSSLTALAILWWWMLDARHGLVNVVLDMLGVPAVDWLHDPRFALLGLATLEWWRACGLFIFFLAALQTVPAQLWDAAALDGAGAWARLRHVTLPALRPMIFFVGATLAMESFQAFDQIYVITQGEGGPAESTTTLSFLLYKTGFVHFKMGEASALALVSAMILLLVILLQRRVLLGGEGR